MYVDTTSEMLQTSNILENVYAISIILEGELYLAEMQAAVGKNYGKLQFSLNNFQNIMKKNLQTKKSIWKPQATQTIFRII